jgi:hypothetical protein
MAISGVLGFRDTSTYPEGMPAGLGAPAALLEERFEQPDETSMMAREDAHDLIKDKNNPLSGVL